MKVIGNTMEIFTERWDDPGEYPSNAGGSSLPSYWYVEGNGSLILELEEGENLDEIEEDTDCFVASFVKVPRHVSMCYNVSESNGIVVITPDLERSKIDIDLDMD